MTTLDDVVLNGPHVAAHNEERETINSLIDLIETGRLSESALNDLISSLSDIKYLIKGQTSTVNQVYVSTTGSDSNDGLAVGTPFATFQKAFDYLASQGPYLQGQWYVNVAAGTYTGQFDAMLTTRSVNRIIVRGPSVGGHPNVPTAIISGAGGLTYQHGLRASGVGVRVEFRDLKVINFAALNTSIGLVGENESDVVFTNCHGNNCSWTALYAFNTIRARVAGGILDGCRSGFIANDTEATVSDTKVWNCTESGIYWSRGSQGHVDNVEFEDNSVGLYVSQSSRVDTVADSFKRNVVGIRCDSGGVYGEGGDPNVFGTGGDANGTNVQYKAFSGDTTELHLPYSASPVRVGYDRLARTVTGTTALTNLVPTVYTIPAYRLQGVGKTCRVVVRGIYTMTTGSSLTMRIGSNVITAVIPSAANNVSFEFDVTLYEVQGGYRSFSRLTHGVNSLRMNGGTGFTNSSAQNISVDVTPMDNADTVTVYCTEVYLQG